MTKGRRQKKEYKTEREMRTFNAKLVSLISRDCENFTAWEML